MNRIKLMNYIIAKFAYKNYIEIGLYSGKCFGAIQIENKISIDIDELTKPTFLMTSDDFFKQNKENFDIIFIDGLHHKEQVKKDIENSIKFLNKNGTIILHDCNPQNEEGTRVPRETVVWWGDVWKEFVKIRQNENIDSCCTDFDEGCGILRIRKNQKKLEKFESYDLSYQALNENRHYWLNIKPLNEIEKWI